MPLPDDLPSKIESIRKEIPSCLYQASDGRFYATSEGAEKLEQVFRRNGIPVKVSVDENFRFKIDHEDPNLEVKLF